MITTYSYHFVQTVFFVFPRNSKHLEYLENDDKETSLQFCVCPQKSNDCICEKEWNINLVKVKIANF